MALTCCEASTAHYKYFFAMFPNIVHRMRVAYALPSQVEKDVYATMYRQRWH